MTVSKINALTKFVAVHAEANALMREHGLFDGDQPWTFELSNKKRALGTCYYDQRKIVFSKYYIDSDPAQITDTLLHEIAHALAFIEYGSKGIGHGFLWKQIARRIGADPTRTAHHEPQAGRAVVNAATHNYEMHCPNCRRIWKRYRMRTRNYGSKCPDCNIEVEIYRITRNPT